MTMTFSRSLLMFLIVLSLLLVAPVSVSGNVVDDTVMKAKDRVGHVKEAVVDGVEGLVDRAKDALHHAKEAVQGVGGGTTTTETSIPLPDKSQSNTAVPDQSQIHSSPKSPPPPPPQSPPQSHPSHSQSTTNDVHSSSTSGGSVKDRAQSAYDSVKGSATDAATKLKTAAGEAANTVKTAATDAANAARAKVKGAAETINEKLHPQATKQDL